MDTFTWIVGITSFAVGLSVGGFAGRKRLGCALWAAPFLAGAVMFVVMVAVGVASGRPPVNPDNPNPLILQHAASACLFLPGAVIIGALPALAGATAAHFLRRWIASRTPARRGGPGPPSP